MGKNSVIKESEQKVSIVDLILIDHTYLKSCIRILKDEEANAREKLTAAHGFLDALQKHSTAEKISLYTPLKPQKELRSNILEGEVEHGIVDKKVKLLKPKVAKGTWDEKLEAELKVLAELVELHLKEEESEMLPKIRREIDHAVLIELGARFLKLRKFKMKDLKQSPKLQTELLGWKISVQELSKKFVSKMDKYIASMRT